MGLPVHPLGYAIFSQLEMVGAISGIVTGSLETPGFIFHPYQISGT